MEGPLNKTWTLLGVAFLIGIGQATAQTLDTLHLSLEDAVAAALENNHDLEAARLEVERADARVQEAWGTALPTLDFNATYSYALKKQVFFLPDFLNPGSDVITPIEIGATHAINAGFLAEQVLFDAAVFIGVGAAHTYAQGARELYRATEIDVITEARKAFYGVLVSAEVYALARENLTFSQDNHATVKALASQGLVAEYDLLRAEVTVENLRPEVINAENAYRQTLNNLKQRLGIPYDRPVSVVGSLEYRPVPDSVISIAQQRVLQENASLSALRYQGEVNDALSSAQRSYYLPTLSAFGNYQWVSQQNSLAISTNDFIPYSTVGLSLRFNLFNGLQTGARVEQAELEYRKTQEQIAGLELSLQSATEATVLELQRDRQRIESQGRTIQQAERGYQIATARYASGSGTQLEVNDAQLALARAKVNHIEAVYSYLIAAIELDRLLASFPKYVNRSKE
jgi:outer membrane protein